MPVDQTFKDQCDKILKDWQELIGTNWAGISWEDLCGRITNGKDNILADPFFTSFKDRTAEEQKYMFKQIEDYYNIKSAPSGVYDLKYCANSLRGNSTNIGVIAVNFYDLKNNFLKMVDVDKWEDTEKINELKKNEEKLQKDYDELLAKIGKTSPGIQLKDEYIEIKVPLALALKDVPSELWDKVEVGNDWDKDYQVDNKKELPIMINHHTANVWDKRFKSDELLSSFKKYTNEESDFYIWRGGAWGAPKIKDIANYNGDVDDDRNWYYIGEPKKLTQYLRDANKLFIKDGYGKTTDKEAFEFLQSIIESRDITATIKLTEKDIKNLEEQIQVLQDKLQQETAKVSSLETKLEDQQINIDDLDKENQGLKNQIEELQEQLQQAKASSSLVGQEGEKLDWIKLLNLKNISIHHANLSIYLKEDKAEVKQEEVYWKDIFAETGGMKKQACSWLINITDSINKEVIDYNSNVARIKGDSYHQRGHYFIFYEDGSKDHWLALYPMFKDSELVDGHTHKAFILEFDKPVKKFVDVYTCIGCGAAGQGYTALHGSYDDDSSDSWNDIHKGLPFNPWYEEFTSATLKDMETSSRNQAGEEVTPTIEQFWVSPNGKFLGNKSDVWQGQEIKDEVGKTFDRAYGFISEGGTIQWKLEGNLQRVEENKQLAIDKVPEYINSLWENKEFTNWKDESPCKQAMMYSFVKDCLDKEDHLLVFKYSGGGKETLKINYLLEKVVGNFEELISAKEVSKQFLEKWIKQILDGSNIREEVRNDEEFIALKNKPLAVREVWGQQVERFIQENKGEKFYSEHHQKGLTWEDHARIKIDWLYEEVRNNLELENQVFEAQVEVAAK